MVTAGRDYHGSKCTGISRAIPAGEGRKQRELRVQILVTYSRKAFVRDLRTSLLEEVSDQAWAVGKLAKRSTSLKSVIRRIA